MQHILVHLDPANRFGTRDSDIRIQPYSLKVVISSNSSHAISSLSLTCVVRCLCRGGAQRSHHHDHTFTINVTSPGICLDL